MWHKHGVTRSRTQRPPLDRRGLEELALRYVGRFATSRGRLRAYLERKLRERGWAGPGDAAVDDVVERLAALGYVDDAAFAMSRGRALASRGYGSRRLAGALAAAGVGEDDARPAIVVARDDAAESVLRFARRRRIGPFADSPGDRATREKWLAAMVRAGHDFPLARKVAEWPKGSAPEPDDLIA